jgi:hypothetical protein
MRVPGCIVSLTLSSACFLPIYARKSRKSHKQLKKLPSCGESVRTSKERFFGHPNTVCSEKRVVDENQMKDADFAG